MYLLGSKCIKENISKKNSNSLENRNFIVKFCLFVGCYILAIRVCLW